MHKTATKVEDRKRQNNSENKENFFSDSKKLLENYVQDRILLLKLEWTKKAATAGAGIANALIFALLVLLLLIFFGLTLGFVLSELTGSYIWGFAIVTGIDILLIVLLLTKTRWVTKKLSGAFISLVFSMKDEKANPNDHNNNFSSVQKN